MSGHVACLRGWHPALAKAEFSAMFPNNKLEDLESPRLISVFGNLSPNMAFEGIECCSGTRAVLLNSVKMSWGGSQHEIDSFLVKITEMIEQSGKSGSLGVFPWRQEGRIAGLSSSKLAGSIGGIASKSGFSIDLKNPNHKLGLVLDGVSNLVICGWMVGFGDESDRVTSRKATERPFFKPISLDPRLARLAVNLASGPISAGVVLDPMTGTGGFAIEAAIMGRDIIALDLNQEMVDGTETNIEWSLKNDNSINRSMIKVIQGDATKLKTAIDSKWHGEITGLVFDPPYGRNSHGSLSHENLIKNTLLSFRDIAHQDAKMVLIIPLKQTEIQKIKPLDDSQEIDLLHGNWRDFKEMLIESGWNIEGRWIEHVHSSLSRLILHASIVPQG